MSRGRYCLMRTILADLAGLGLSYLYGAWLLPTIGKLLPAPLRFVCTAARWLYTRPLVLLPWPRALQVAFFHNAGLMWLAMAVLFHLSYLLRSLHRRARCTNLGKPYVGGEYWGLVQRRFEEYAEATKRWQPTFPLHTPTWRYYQRRHSGQPDLFWRGRTLVIEKDLLCKERLHELCPFLARELMYYNSEDVAFKDILACYPDRLSRWLLLWHLLGFCFLLPPMLTKRFIWPSYWEKRILVADAFASLLQQGYVLYTHIDMQLQQQEHIRGERREVTRQIAGLEQWLREDVQKKATGGYSPPSFSGFVYQGFNGSADQLLLTSLQCEQHLGALRQRQAHLLQQEQQAFETHPMWEERREQLIALLKHEQEWLEQRGVAVPAPSIAKPLEPDALRQIQPGR